MVDSSCLLACCAGLFAPLPLYGRALASQSSQHALQHLPFLLSANFALDANNGRQICGLHEDAQLLSIDPSQVCTVHWEDTAAMRPCAWSMLLSALSASMMMCCYDHYVLVVGHSDFN